MNPFATSTVDTLAPATRSIDVPGVDFLTFTFDSSICQDGTKPIFVDAQDSDRSLNYTQTRTLVRKLIAGFKASGLQPGDCVLVALANTFLYSAIYFSIIGAGGVYFGTNPANQVFELAHIIKLGEPTFIITSSDVLPNVLKATEDLLFTPDRLMVLDSKTFPLSTASRLPASPPLSEVGTPTDEDPKLYKDLVSLTQHGEGDWLRIQDEAMAKATPLAMFSTSGTSGLPKAAIVSHYAMISQSMSLEVRPSYEVVRLISLPFFHVFSALFAHVFPVRLGQPLYVLPRFQMEQYLDAVKQFEITDTIMAPPIIHALNQSTLPLCDLLESIRWLGVGGAPIAADAMQTFKTKLHHTATLSQVWGMTEIGAATCIPYPEQHCDGSIGRPLPGYEFRLVDAFGGIVHADHEPGELQVLYPGMMTGYKNQPVHNEGEWYATGDIMSRLEGKYYVVGRSKELIKVNGWQVAPAELEAVLMTHPCISDAGVIGVLREDGVTEMPRAYVVRKGNEDGRCSTTSAEEIFDYSRARLASYKSLNGGVFFVDHIPRTASGKIQRFKLAQMDSYRYSVTELLVRNSSTVAEKKRGKITDLKARAEERRTSSRRGSKVSVSSQGESSGSVQEPQQSRPTRRSRTSLVDKLKALEASRIMSRGGG